MSKNPNDPQEPGEFTRFFGKGGVPIDQPPAQPAPATDSSATPLEETTIAQGPLKPKDVTRPAPPKPQPQRPERPANLPLLDPLLSAKSGGPGEFTRVFRPGGEPPKPTAPVGDKPAAPGEFTQVFSPPAARTRQPSAPEHTVPARPAPLTGGQSGSTPVSRNASPKNAGPTSDSEFTRYFQSPQFPDGREVNWKEVEARPAPEPDTKASGEFTHLFGPSVPEAPAAPVAKEAPPIRSGPSRSPAPPSQSDEFAKVIAQRPSPEPMPARPAAGAPPAAAAAPAKTDGKRPGAFSPAILAVIIAAVLLLAACAIYFVVVRK